MAHKKGTGSSRNGRDSAPQYRGLKRFGGETVTCGTIIVRQLGTKYKAGLNTKIAKDFSLFATADGVVRYGAGRRIHVDPVAAK
jgi:large subunit ribosomal protein L27